MKCKNCGNEVRENFCGKCGQELNISRLTLKEIFIQFFQVVTRADSSLIGFIKDLFVKPGIVAKEYVEGKRKKYYSPFRYLLVVITLYALFYFINTNLLQSNNSSSANEEVKKIIEFEKFYNNNHRMIMFLSLPVTSLISWILFFKSKYNYAENLLLNILVDSQLILINTIIFTFLIIVSLKFDILYILAYSIVSLVYTVIAYTQFFTGRKIFVITKAVIFFLIVNLMYYLFIRMIF